MKYISTIFLILIAPLSFSQNGQVDTSFGTNGMKKVVTNLYGYQSTPNPPSVDKVIFGSTNETVYLTNDMKTKAITVFGSTPTNGFTFPDFVSGWDQITRFSDATFDTNQLIYITGYTSKEDNNKAFFAARLKRGTGSNISKWVMDSGFNIDGKLVFDTPEVNEEAVAIKALANGKCVLTGFSGNKGIIVRYNSEGFLDKTFNQCGFYTFQIGASSKPTTMVVQTDGKVVVAGNTSNGADTDFFITRLNNDGTLDTGFGVNGFVVKDVGNQNNNANSMAIGADGAFYIAGKTYMPTGTSCPGLYGYNASVFKYDTNGQSVASFGNSILPGAYIFPGCYVWGTDRFALDSEYNYIIYKEGCIYCVGYQEAYNSPYLHGVQFQLNVETPYTGHSFGWNYPNPTTYNVVPMSVEIKPSDNSFYSVVKYDNCTVGQTPTVKMPSNNFPSGCISSSESSILFKKIVKTSTGYYGLDHNKKLFKMDNNFNLDTSFAGSGYLYDIRNFNVDSNDKIICNLGETNSGSIKYVMEKYNPDGRPDTAFGFYGTIPITPLLWINGITVTAQNDYLVTKTYPLNGNTKISLSKLTNTGQPVTSFGTGGSIELYSVPIISSSYSLLNAAEDMVKDNFGNYYTLVYHIGGGNGPSFIKIMKILPNGTIDNTFGTSGIVDINSITLNASYKLNIAINNVNGKLIVYNKNNVLQFNLNGSVDTGFGSNGIYDVNLLLTDFGIGRVLVKGADYFIGGNNITNGNSNIVKINSSGTLDTSFGTNSGYYQETGLSNPSYVQAKDMFLEGNSIYFYLNGIKKLN
jgi:uncharacterized delta-60 repeat protein